MAAQREWAAFARPLCAMGLAEQTRHAREGPAREKPPCAVALAREWAARERQPCAVILAREWLARERASCVHCAMAAREWAALPMWQHGEADKREWT